MPITGSHFPGISKVKDLVLSQYILIVRELA